MRHVHSSHIRRIPAIHEFGGRLLLLFLALLIASCGSSSGGDTRIHPAPPLGNDALLVSLSLDDVNLDPAFNASVTDYTGTVDHQTTSTHVTATTQDADATISVNGTAVTSGVASNTIELDIPNNNISVVVTAEDDNTTQTYAVVVTRCGPDDLLALLTFFGETHYCPGDYTTYAAFSASSMQVTATATNPIAAVTVNGIEVASGVTSDPIALSVGWNRIEITVIAGDGATNRNHRVDVYRNSPGFSLSMTGASLVPEFSWTVTDYVAAVGYLTDSTRVTATSTDPDAIITVNGTEVASGVASDPIPLDMGTNLITVAVTAEDGVFTQNYTIVVIRADAASLIGLSMTGVRLDPEFSPSVTDYTSIAGYQVTSTRVTATASDPGATITVNGIGVLSGVESDPIELDAGSNAITVNVTPEDGTTTNTYTVVVTRQGALDYAQSAYIKASNTDRSDRFGSSVALSADGLTMAIGATGEDGSGVGVNPDEANDNAESAGAVYVFARDGTGAWTQQAYVKASNTDGGDEFGNSVALSADGATLAVGAWGEDSAATGVNGDQLDTSAENAGAVYVFARGSGGVWIQQAYMKASNTDAGDEFGSTVALSANGSTLAVGAHHEGSIAIGVNGDEATDDALQSGAAYIFSRDGAGTWGQDAYVKASNTDIGDAFGSSVGLSADGSTLAVGAAGEDSAASGVNGDQLDTSAENAGAVYVFARNSSGLWTQQAYVKASNTNSYDEFGSSVALSADGSTLAVGATGEGSATTGVNGDESDNSFWGAGAAYVFTRDSDDLWAQRTYVKSSEQTIAYCDCSEKPTTAKTDQHSAAPTGTCWDWCYFYGSHFGHSVSLSADGTRLTVGAVDESSAATGVNGDETDANKPSSGAAYFFELL